MKVGVPKETHAGERRVALVPDSVTMLKKAGHDVLIEAGAGAEAGFGDAAYTDKGAAVATDRSEVFSSADLVLQVRGLGANLPAGRDDLSLMKPGQTVVAMFDPLSEPDSVKELAERKVTAFAMELMPRNSPGGDAQTGLGVPQAPFKSTNKNASPNNSGSRS